MKDEAAGRLKKALEIEPDDWLVNETHGFYYYLKREYEHAVRLLLDGSKFVKDSNNPNFKADFALAYAAVGDRENAVKWLRELISVPEETSQRTVYIAYVYAGLGETDEFFVFANRAFKEKTLHFWRPKNNRQSDSRHAQDSRRPSLFRTLQKGQPGITSRHHLRPTNFIPRFLAERLV